MRVLRRHSRGRSARVVSAVVLVTTLAACGDDGTGPADDTLTDVELDLMMEALVATGGLTFAGLGATAPAGLAKAVTTETETISDDVPCPAGGSVEVRGQVTSSYDDVTEEFWSDFDVTQKHQGCKASTESGKTFTFNGSPSITLAMEMAFAGESLTMEGSQSGGVRWSFDGRSGTCEMDFDYAVTISFTSEEMSGTAGGTICGRPVSDQF